ncbi:D-alanyl-D-alanine carboxypeptidase [Mangrovimicrobium sediminis]|uniref:serine-type D-Ala-D-Ala carboxypeptidase n=1 Tax=Mangrovimicrobium sediminis TaxID=2562682 RepID=A0A4Z0M472_9GAMM|nr:D-alanyl-D-alanine carboxypeptidase family protein [Haliea sp. SAOS-164]TGD74240.1 D-alanyl-D-alanine carboxypeptidase [Haliea sp. SAOS-164]
MRRLLSLLVFTLFSLQATAAPTPAPPQVAARAYILMDADSGAVLAESNADERLPPASLTKMMTSYVLANEIKAGRVKKSDMVVVSENAWSQNPIFEGSSLMWIEPGKDVSVEDLERGIIISSGNDACVAVAEHIAGSEKVFVDMMNAEAEQLGMYDSHYMNSHGLPDPEHYTTARDLALLARATVQNHPEQYPIYAEREFTYNDITQYNRNTLLGQDSTVDGLKTGHTKEAGYCLVASAKRRGMRLISVVLGTDSTRARASESRSLLNYGFRFFETTTVESAGRELDSPRIWKGQLDNVPVGLAEDIVLTVPRGATDSVQTSITLPDELVAPVSAGDVLGTIEVTLDDERLYKGDVVALTDVEPAGLFARLWDMVLMWIHSLFSV